MKIKKKLSLTSYCYLLPCMLVFAVFLFYPFVKTVYLSREDVVRHRLVKEILKAYEDEQMRKENMGFSDSANKTTEEE